MREEERKDKKECPTACCEAGTAATIAIISGVQLRPVSTNKKNDNIIVRGKVIGACDHPGVEEDCGGM
jgi:hypothetical protein